MKYACPKCGSQLMFWEEYIFEKQRLVNIKTGHLNKKVINSLPIAHSTSGLKCTVCEFNYSGSEPESNYETYDNLIEIFEKV